MKNSIGSKSQMLAAVALFTVLCITGSCNKSSNPYDPGMTTTTTGPGANEVFLQNTAFSPTTLTVTVGTTVTWTNKDSFAHTVTSDTKVFDSGNLSSGKTFSFTFGTAGTYPYHCTIHPHMTATITVN